MPIGSLVYVRSGVKAGTRSSTSVNCRTGCPTKDHESYADCLRDSGIRVAYSNSANGYDLSKQKRWDQELSDYRDLRAQGIQPDGTTRRAIDKAARLSDEAGVAYTGGAL